MKLIFFISAIVIIPLVALANELPWFDVEKHCDAVSQFTGGSMSMYNGCIDSEQKAYNNLRIRWSQVPAKIRRYCTEVAEFSGRSYLMLDGCVTIEQDAASEKKSFRR